MTLQNYDVKFEYVPDRNNTVAGALSRNIISRTYSSIPSIHRKKITKMLLLRKQRRRRSGLIGNRFKFSAGRLRLSDPFGGS